KTEYQLKKGELKAMGLTGLEESVKTAFKGTGCPICNNTGYLGRTTIGEIFIVSDDIRELIYSGASVGAIKEVAIRNGMTTIRENGIRKAIAGITTFVEILRVTG
ncbi:MAG TPA: type II secretion system protein GspE, partial [Nitrospiraceae bacterium]|nr:type II secretion system protein GspE [Nitrospiraceae bacterium]